MGIDPGLEGAWVVIDENGKIVTHYKFQTFDTVNSKRKLDFLGIYDSMESSKFIGHCPLVTIEAIHGSAGQHPSSIFSMGHSLGALEAIVAVSNRPYQTVSPQKWKNAMLSGMGKEKDASVQKALMLFPESNKMLIGPRGGRDHNIADALLIAEWARRQFITG